MGDGALEFWTAMAEEFLEAREQRCWVHKTANILDKLPKRMQPQAKKLIHEMCLAATRADAENICERITAAYGGSGPRWSTAYVRTTTHCSPFTTSRPTPDQARGHLRTTKPIESTVATIRNRTRQTKGCGSPLAMLTTVFKLATQARIRVRARNS